MMKTMHKLGLRVLYIRGILYTCLGMLFAIGFTLSAYFLEWKAFKVVMAVSIGITIFLALYFIIVAPRYRYTIFKYQYDARKIFIQKGLFFIKQTRVPLYRIQNVEIEEGWLMRRYQLANILMYTAGGLVSVKLIHKNEAQKLNAFIRQHGMIEKNDSNSETIFEHKENEPI
ncbi:PH domain-containing protein [Staphylococcus hyicus]|uniref:PH domain-containing protein n=2 Tax=Staphylococcus hyicus TaxID=1284 RepID=UPI00273A2095|nr:PH domain-containing protein [Staphylococcus hyicus]MDP4449539.1 PH domain-containing protein [Staphylococcus hyicus]